MTPNTEIFYKNLLPRDVPDPNAKVIPSGRWAVGTRSTCPFVRVTVGSRGAVDLTWGGSIEVPEGQTATVTNGSFHSGDVHLVALGEACHVPRTPAALSVPATFFLDSTGTRWLSQPIDVRGAKTAYLWVLGLTADFVATVRHKAPDRGAPFPDGTVAATAPAAGTGGEVVDTVPVTVVRTCISLGIGSGRLVDPAGRSIADGRPHALLDQLVVDLPTGIPGFELGPKLLADSFVTLEY